MDTDEHGENFVVAERPLKIARSFNCGSGRQMMTSPGGAAENLNAPVVPAGLDPSSPQAPQLKQRAILNCRPATSRADGAFAA